MAVILVTEGATHYSSTSNKRSTNAGEAWTIELPAAEVNLLQLPITFPLKQTEHNLSLLLTLCRVGCYHRTAWVRDKWSERVYVCLWFMYCCVHVRRPSYQDHHLPVDTEMLQQWRDPFVDPETCDTHLEQRSTPGRDWRGLLQEEGGKSSLLLCFSFSFRGDWPTLSLSLRCSISFCPLCPSLSH